MSVGSAISALLETTIATLRARQRMPESTYRLQFHSGFTFRDACELVPYLHELGITDCYASPYLKARPGSKHGYDISDHRQLNPEIGGEADYEAWITALHSHGMGQLLDVVPNHMGIVGNENQWWNDILENGPSSPFAGFFDVDWLPVQPALREKVLLPLLGNPYGKALEARQIQLSFDSAGGAFQIHYFDHVFPVGPRTYQGILSHRLAELEKSLGSEAPALLEYQSILTAISHLPLRSETDPQRLTERQREKGVIKRRLATLAENSAEVRHFILENIALFNGKEGEPQSFDLLDALLNEQAYRLAYWRVASDEINYRRFFDINELAALSMEKPEVFSATHELIFRLLREGKVTGLRIDHPDGLYDPAQYLQRVQEHYVLEQARSLFLRQPDSKEEDWKELEPHFLEEVRKTAARDVLLRRPLYLLVEKILGRNEPIPEDWPVHGTTGYEFLNSLNGLFVDATSERAFSRLYERWTGLESSFWDVVYQKKFLILQVALSGELHVLGHQLDRISERNRWSRDFTLNSLRHALRVIIACFPVYRSYLGQGEIQERDRFYVDTAVALAKRKNPATSATIFDFVRDTLLFQNSDLTRDEDREEQRRFVGKFQQVTAPVMAKGLEDTAFYVYNRLLSLNEVGGEPGQFGISLPAFHERNQERQAKWPHALSATATHDTKRGEDVRARLNALSELPQEWHRCLSRWSRFNRRYHTQLPDLLAPDRNDEYLLYQTLLGAWPMEPYDARDYTEFVDRIQSYMQKAINEAKVHTSWINPNAAYDNAVRHFVAGILDEKRSKRFLNDFRLFQQRISHYGMFNSLAQLLLKITSPGVPDFYQGAELWDFSLVDPDNRRPVDYQRRKRLLHELKQRRSVAGSNLLALAGELLEHRHDGRIKMYVTTAALHCRREHPSLFSTGQYQPVTAVGERQDSVCAFVRSHEGQSALIAVPRLITRLCPQTTDLALGETAWKDTRLLLPSSQAAETYGNLFTGEVYHPIEHEGQNVLPAAQVFAHFPVALLLDENTMPKPSHD